MSLDCIYLRVHLCCIQVYTGIIDYELITKFAILSINFNFQNKIIIIFKYNCGRIDKFLCWFGNQGELKKKCNAISLFH